MDISCSVQSQQQGQKFQLAIPMCFREELLKFAYDSPLSGHFGRLKTLLWLLEVAFWPSVRKDVWKYCRDCQVWQQCKPSITKMPGKLQSTPDPDLVGVALMGPFPIKYQTIWIPPCCGGILLQMGGNIPQCGQLKHHKWQESWLRRSLLAAVPLPTWCSIKELDLYLGSSP